MNILLIAATEAEIAPLIKHISDSWHKEKEGIYSKNGSRLTIAISGVGMLAMAYKLTKKISEREFDLVIQAGIAGAYNKDIELGEVVFVRSDTVADLRVEDDERYINMFELGLIEKGVIPYDEQGWLNNDIRYPKEWVDSIRHVSAITVNTVTGKQSTVDQMIAIYNADLESMEGAAMHYVCLLEEVPFIQIRAISNYVEIRDREKWQMSKAIDKLNNYLMTQIA